MLSLISLKDYFYGGLLVAVIVGFGTYTIHERHLGAAHEAAALKASSDKLEASAAARVAALTHQHEKDVQNVTQTLDTKLQAALAQHDSDAQRLREYDTYRRAHPAVDSASGGPAPAGAGAGSASSVGDVLTGLEQVALDLAAANRSGYNALTACMAERDSLTGK